MGTNGAADKAKANGTSNGTANSVGAAKRTKALSDGATNGTTSNGTTPRAPIVVKQVGVTRVGVVNGNAGSANKVEVEDSK